MEGSANERLDFGKMGYGCRHYRRRCKIRAPCCNEMFECRHCHNEAVVICSVCDTEQPVARVCTNCGVNMGEYFCEICKFYDDDVVVRTSFTARNVVRTCDQSDFVVTVIRNDREGRPCAGARSVPVLSR
ncbi:hypothetical protein Dsin_029357 [Dipteronia sinensis]|uniref:CHY-type domain-containing protein n=1 Tax=Dipteronia sinensis TaxID=43782 RepID=A0AAD9ZTR8_9ROSI|nr:hypothetical protein Dsin_029357 [Dipteronia sinensis]